MIRWPSKVGAFTLTLPITPQDRSIAHLATLGIVLSVFESGLPSPIVGVKLGLANLVTLIAWVRLGATAAIQVSFIRILAGALFTGSVFTPGFFLALSGGIASLGALSLAARLFKPPHFSLISWSLLAALAHIGGQIALVGLYRWIPWHGVLWFMPILLLSAWLTGLLNGWIARRILESSHHA